MRYQPETRPANDHNTPPAQTFPDYALAETERLGLDHPEFTDVFFDLDGTLFAHYHDDQGREDATNAVGRWREDTLDTLRAFKERGYQCHILSSTPPAYVRAVLRIFQIQFQIDPGEFFGSVFRSGAVAPGSFHKSEARLALARESALKGRDTVFIDDTPEDYLGKESAGAYTYIQVPDALKCRCADTDFEQYWVSLED